MIRVSLAAAWLALAVLLAGCTITGLEETASREAWPVDAEAVFGCTPVSIDLFGGTIRGSGSGVFVADRWILTAAHVVPDDATHAWIWAHRPDGPLAVVAPLELVITGGGDPVGAGDWALLRVPAMAQRLGATTAPLVEADSLERATLVGFPTVERADSKSTRGTPSSRSLVVLQSERPGPVPFLDDAVDNPLRYFRMVRGWSALGGASGGPVVAYDDHGRPGVAGIVLGRVEYRGLWRRGRAIVAHAVPPQAFLAARGVLDHFSPIGAGPRSLVWGSGQPLPTLTGDGHGVSQRQAASRR